VRLRLLDPLEFGEAWILSQEKGVKILVLDCEVTEKSIEAKNFVEVCL